VARVAPTTMIFVPCAGGISHNEAESTSPDECAAGAQVLLNAVLEFDRRLR
jgi:beta-ureidopropionase / N-carbamoyl-L-amino-acid hydrolase